MSTLNLSNERHLKLKKIKDNLRFPDDQSSSLPYLANEVTSCSTVLKPDSDHEVEETVEDALTQRYLINWCRTIHNVHPLKVTGHGSQFLSAISMALWGFCDAADLLRRFLFVSVSDFAKHVISERWDRSKDSAETRTAEVGFKRLMDMARCSSEGGESSEIVPNEFPHPLHIFIMANILRRPIVIAGDENDAHVGLYLPVLSKPEDCTKWPLILAVYDGLFFPLVNKECIVTQKKLAEFAIPLVSSELRPVKVMFLLEAEENEAFALLQKYVFTTELNLTRSSDVCLILSAKLNNLPFEVSSNSPPSPNVKESSSNQRLVPNIMPSAPSASIVTVNNLSGVSPCIEERREVSMLGETCRFAGCHFFVSRYTEPFCWEHVQEGNNTVYESGPARSSEVVEISLVNERCREARCPHFASRFVYPYCYEHIDKKTVECFARTKPKQNQLPSDCSVVMEYCHHGNCKNYASQYVYPFCYEHLDDNHSVGGGTAICSSPKVNEPTISKEFDMSIMAECCAHPNCNNRASKYTFPVCYEHLDSPLAVTRAAAATRVVQLPQTGQPTRLLNESQQGTPRQALEVQGIDKKFEETMRELEARTGNGPLCLKSGCTNFGNGRCRGYCHSCYNSLNRL